MKKIFFTLVATLCLTLGAEAQDAMTLDAPELEPVLLTGAELAEATPRLSLYDVSGRQTASQTPLLSDPSVVAKPNYKFMDDMTFIGVPLFVAGIIAKGEKKAFRQDYNNSHSNTRLLTNFKTGIDDYTQYFGPAMTLGLKLGGVEGRSDWTRLLVSSAMSYGLMAAFVNSIKYTATELRPDGSTRNSWPSGHTATSFVGATILHKEYGMTRSPWFSVAGYGVATATGVMRVLNNRHWVSDVLSGAGIGIISGELAYALSDLIYKDRHLLRGDRIGHVDLGREHPSFFDISMGLGLGSNKISFGEGSDAFDLKFRSATVVQAEGAYFFNKYVGLGGRLKVRTSPINGWSNLLQVADDDVNAFMAELQDFDSWTADVASYDNMTDMIREKSFSIESDHLTEFTGSVGLYFNLPLSERFALGTKLLVGRSIMQSLEIDARFAGSSLQMDYDMLISNGDIVSLDINSIKKTGQDYVSEWDYLTLKGGSSTSFGTGLSLTYSYKNNFCWKVFCDYDYTHKDYTLTYDPNNFIYKAMPDMVALATLTGEDVEPMKLHKKKHMNMITLGASISIHF